MPVHQRTDRVTNLTSDLGQHCRWIQRTLAASILALGAGLPLAAQAPAAAAIGAIIVRAGERTTTLSRAELAALPHRTIRILDETDSATVSGVALWDVLQKVGIPSAEASGRQRAVMYVRLTGADGQSAVIALVEVDPSFSRRMVLLADRRGARAMDDSEGPWRAILPDDSRHARWVRGVVTISVETAR